MSATPTYDPDVDKPVEDMLKRASARAEKSLQERNAAIILYLGFGALLFFCWFIGYTDRWGLLGCRAPKDRAYYVRAHVGIFFLCLLVWPFLTMAFYFVDGKDEEGL